MNSNPDPSLTMEPQEKTVMESPSLPTTSDPSSENSKPRLTPTEILEKKIPYIKYEDQYISTEKWPDKLCNCKGVGHYCAVAPKGQASVTKLEPNKQCICGSGKKYKKCCQNRVKRLQKSSYRILICHCVGKAELAQNPFLEQMKAEFDQTMKAAKK